MKKIIHKRQLNQKGMSVVTVLIAIAFVGILVTTILYVTLLNYQMRATNLKEKNTFYSAEQVLDEIRAGLAVDMGNAMSDAYSYVLERYSVTEGAESDSLRLTMFKEQYLNNLKEELGQNQADQNHYKLEYLTSLVESSGKTGNFEISSSKDAVMLKSVTKGIILEGVKVTFVEEDGHASIINTDLVLSIPDIHFTQSTSMPDLMNMTLIADKSMVIEESEHTVFGSVYGGTDGIILEDNAAVTFEQGERVVTGGPITVKTGSRFTTGETMSLWASNLLLEGNNSAVHLLGRTYLSDDLTIKGSGCTVEAGGEYYGFGNPTSARAALCNTDNDIKGSSEENENESSLFANTSDKDLSSSILVNGQNTTLDFSGLKKLLLAGNSYISIPTSKITDSNGTSSQSAGGQILMGESITVKSNQLAYLVPTEAIGDGKSYGNPMSRNEYEQLMEWVGSDSSRTMVNVETELEELGNQSLEDFGVQDGTLVAYQNSDEPLFYLYLDFVGKDASKITVETAEKNAAAYMEAYNKIADRKNYLEKYLNFYLKNGSIINQEDNFLRYTTNGNLLIASDTAGENSLITSSDGKKSEESRSNLIEEEAGYQDSFYALNKKMITSYASLSGKVVHYDQDGKETGVSHNEKLLNRTVFDNLIDRDSLKNYLSTYGSEDNGNQYYYFETKTGYRAYLIAAGDSNITGGNKSEETGNFTLTKDFVENNNPRLIICLGNVTVDNNVSYEGILIASGTVTLKNKASLHSSAEDTAKVFQCRYKNGQTEELSNEERCPMDFFWDGEEYILNGVATGSISSVEENSLDLSDLILYENWEKQ
ncbi:MAG: hypothetical protein Q4B70_07640 [Lachnospiraceae bacterium]|nr:hypothetical protein [Lachnospiraceae bacterium]